MTLEETIEHYQNIAEDWYLDAATATQFGLARSCFECAKENGQLADWLIELKKYREQRPCGDCISRQEAYKVIHRQLMGERDHKEIAEKEIMALPSVTPTKPRGEWLKEHTFYVPNQHSAEGIATSVAPLTVAECSVCGKGATKSDFCPNCGADMRGEEE